MHDSEKQHGSIQKMLQTFLKKSAFGPRPQKLRKWKVSISMHICSKAVNQENKAYSHASFPGLSSTFGYTFPGRLVGMNLSVNRSAFMTTSARTSVS